MRPAGVSLQCKDLYPSNTNCGRSFLVAKGADMRALDRDGHVPRQLAHLHHHPDTEAVLAKLGKRNWMVHQVSLSLGARLVASTLLATPTGHPMSVVQQHLCCSLSHLHLCD
jgi:hypothetical protein